MNFGRPIVDPERTDLAEDLLDDGRIADPGAAHDLDATVGNPHQYVTSLEFLKQFGLRSLADLPPLVEFADGGSEPAVERLLGSARGQATGNHEPDDPT